ncbi:bZIP transcription factor 46-like isoform X1 [Olea europaea var. sylvestris]|uniref:bZIP transcription factor 46-like isoform X1 n=1 Tax=Olea europaea var. sylvestris TaxID=158386 RepID=UPI000C1CF80F|nr:bZIP transcription factor 46-like isoform X1 [Olea europaea var. sylvestris]
MWSNFNFKNFGNDPPADGGGGGRPPGSSGSFPLTRQSSIYSLTFDELQISMGMNGKDFGSMNMDELLKNIWSAEENQNLGSASGAGGQEGVGQLQRQGSLTLPRTLSQKTVDEVWRERWNEYSGVKNENGDAGNLNMPWRQQTLGEVTLEEFLLKAGVAREDAQFAGNPTGIGGFDDLPGSGNNTGLGFLYQQANRNAGLMANRIPGSGNQIAMQSSNIPLHVNGFRSAAQQMESQQQLTQQELLPNQPAFAYGAPMDRNQIDMQSANLPLNVNGVKPAGQQPDGQQRPVQQQHELLPKQPASPYGAPMGIPSSGQLSSPATRGGILGNSDPVKTNNLVSSAGLQGGGLGVVSLGTGGVSVATGSPAFSKDGFAKNNGDTSSILPVPYVFSGGLRGRKGPALEKVVERRQKRMIKNRESAARSRARKQAYTTELEAEIAKLKEENQGMQNKQAEVIEMQKNQQVLEMMNQQNGADRRCLRRTQTGPW